MAKAKVVKQEKSAKQEKPRYPGRKKGSKNRPKDVALTQKKVNAISLPLPENLETRTLALQEKYADAGVLLTRNQIICLMIHSGLEKYEKMDGI